MIDFGDYKLSSNTLYSALGRTYFLIGKGEGFRRIGQLYVDGSLFMFPDSRCHGFSNQVRTQIDKA